MRTYPYDMETLDYLTALVHVYVWLKSHPATEALAADIVPLKDEWKAVFLQEIQLNEALAEADARVLLSDSELDTLFNAIVNALLTLVNNDRKAPTYVRFMGNDRPSDIRSPVLGEELERLRTWPAGLATLGSSEVVKLAADLAALVPKADATVEAQRTADQQLTDFTEIGPRKVFVDRLNATFKLIAGKVGELAHSPAGATLPADFEDRCFPAEGRSRGPTIRSEERTIARLERQLARHKKLLESLKQKQEDSRRAREEAERANFEAERQRLEMEIAAKNARMAELEAKLTGK